MTDKQYRKRWLRRHSKYEKQGYKIFMSELRKQANKIPFEFLTVANYQTQIENTITLEGFIEAYFKFYSEIGKKEGSFVGENLNKEIERLSKEFSLDLFLSEWDKRLLSWLFENSSLRIVSVRKTFIKYIQEFLAFGLNDGKTIQEMARELQKLINSRNFYRSDALRIVRTETTSAANYAATQAASLSGVLTEKVWISAVDSRTRRIPQNEYSHIAMNGVRVGRNEKFEVPMRGGRFEKLEYPGDPKGSAGNTINCRCASAIVPKRDRNGRLIFST
jgi:uncharacterized protein with gpF-like domain